MKNYELSIQIDEIQALKKRYSNRSFPNFHHDTQPILTRKPGIPFSKNNDNSKWQLFRTMKYSLLYLYLATTKIVLIQSALVHTTHS